MLCKEANMDWKRELVDKMASVFFYVRAALAGIGAFAVLFVAGFFSGYIVEKWPLWMEALK